MSGFLKASCVVFAVATLPVTSVANPLPSLNLSTGSTTVSGLSSGAFMAVQLQIAFSEQISGAGVVAGGPYGCSDGNVYRAVRVCMNAFLGEADANTSMETMRALADAGNIDSLVHVGNDRVYLFHGQADATVARASMDALNQSYAALGIIGDRLVYETDINAGHAFVTERGALECSITGPDFLVDCDFDQAGDMLNHLYPGLSAAGTLPTEGLLEFDQSLYLSGAAGMDDRGYVFVPETCTAGATCRLHIALHGCKQGRERIGDSYARLTGYNRWAEANDIVVLYPQAKTIEAPFWNWFGGNPNGCWDWWGYADDDFLSQQAPQIAAIARMAAALGMALTE